MLRLLLSTALAAAHGAAGANPVSLENARAGTHAWAAAPTSAAALYASEISARPGDYVHLHVSAPAGSRYRIEVYRLGWYGGAGGRLVECLPGCRTDEPGTPQEPAPAPSSDPSAPPVRARWPITDTFVVGRRWPSGYYLVRADVTAGAATGPSPPTYVVVEAPPGRQSRILVQVPVNTWQAYNDWGGVSLYDTPQHARAYRVSFDRPYGADDGQLPPVWELPLVRFLERSGYDVSYQTDVDTDAHPASLLRHRLIVVAGHDEYWTKSMRDAFERALSRGTNLAFMGGNVGFWQMRYEDDDGFVDIDEYRSAAGDPSPDQATKTTRFIRLDPPRPECALLGIGYTGGIGAGGAYVVTAAGAADPWLADTGLTAGATIPGAVGGEWDGLDPRCPPNGETVLFHADVAPQPADAIRYTSPSGGTVFSAGSLTFAQTLDDDGRMRTFMRNVVAALAAPRR